MEKNRDFKGLKKYESLLQTICMTKDYNYLKQDEWEGCLGVACIISIIEGINLNIFSLSKHLDISHDNVHLQKAFERLKINGIFSNKQNIIKDPLLRGEGVNTSWRSAAESEMSAWCHIAGVAAGKIGVGKIVEKI